ncbi:hypothetical protein Mgra_00004977 [Meloidogyne graminicola]|uniref:Uncharacterized protein n=1 Tax=Meloidogyne graminicola TaxID=189291 RepID=A0A8S9ZQZ7_9BILA|nr:hypothetical protein Mgra_00004977 [Meloidogyne graminicola]
MKTRKSLEKIFPSFVINSSKDPGFGKSSHFSGSKIQLNNFSAIKAKGVQLKPAAPVNCKRPEETFPPAQPPATHKIASSFSPLRTLFELLYISLPVSSKQILPQENKSKQINKIFNSRKFKTLRSVSLILLVTGEELDERFQRYYLKYFQAKINNMFIPQVMHPNFTKLFILETQINNFHFERDNHL